MKFKTDRRNAIIGLGAGLVASGLAQDNPANAGTEATPAPVGGKNLQELSRVLAAMPQRRDYKTVPMIVDKPDLWDAAALSAVLAYKGGLKQAWDNTDLAGPWLNGMRNSLNSQIWSFKEPNFLCVSATHGPAHLALFDQDMWDKYQLAKLAGGNISCNTFIVAPRASAHDPADFQSPEGAFSSRDNSIAVLQRRGVVFMACHNAIWEVAERLIDADQNPDHCPVEAITAELTNHLIPHVVLTPGIVATAGEAAAGRLRLFAMNAIMRRSSLLYSLLLLATLLGWQRGPALAQTTPAERLKALEAIYPPWRHGDNSDVVDRGLEFTVPLADVLADFHGSLDHPELVLFASGNYFFAMGPLVKAFGDAYARYRGHVFYETLPPGLLLKQMDAGGTITSGNMTWTVKPDVYLAELAASNQLVQTGRLSAPVITFATNDLAIMVPTGNPARITGLTDLDRAGLTLAMPNPEFEGVARQIRASLVKAGGEALAEKVYGQKVREGETMLTRIHHRQTPLFLMQHLAEAGVTWRSEAIFQEEIGNPIGHVDIPAEFNTVANYSAAIVTGAPHPEAAQAWLEFIGSEGAFKILERFGFKRFGGKSPN
jgi:ABC-type molybdate transport system substrate-binding protein